MVLINIQFVASSIVPLIPCTLIFLNLPEHEHIWSYLESSAYLKGIDRKDTLSRWRTKQRQRDVDVREIHLNPKRYRIIHWGREAGEEWKRWFKNPGHIFLSGHIFWALGHSLIYYPRPLSSGLCPSNLVIKQITRRRRGDLNFYRCLLFVFIVLD